MKPIRVAQIGAGHDHARDILRDLIENPNFELIGVCEDDPAYREAVAGTAWYDQAVWKTMDELLSDDTLEAVVIEKEEKYLVQAALPFAEKGLPIHMDKPGGEDLDDFVRLIGILRKNNTVFQTGYMYRYNPAVIYARELMEQGKLGEILSVEAHMNIKYDRKKTDWLNKFQGGMMFFLGCHLVDLVYTFQGEPQEVIPLNTSARNEGATAPDFGMAAFRYPRGTSFVKTTCSEPDGASRRQLVVTGTEGVVEIRPLERGTYPHDYYADARVVLRDADGKMRVENYTSPKFSRYTAMMNDFAAKIRENKPARFDYDHELAVFTLTLRAAGMIE